MSTDSKLSWYAHRLRAMGIGEAVHRLKERWRHKTDAEFVEKLDEVDVGNPMPQVPLLPHVTSIPWDVRVGLKTDAAELLRGQWQLFGWRMSDVGAPPCWHRDASSGVIVAPEGLSSKLDHRSLPDGADARTIWEINRWSQMTRVAMHAWVDRDMAALEVAQGWIEDWCDRNTVGHGINWTSSLEVGLRLMNFTWFDALVHASGSEPILARQRRLVQRVVPAHALWIKRYLSFGSSANNHLLGELTGLLHAVKRWPGLEAYVGPANEIWDGIADCVMKQFAPDGGNLEQALHYHLFAFEMAWHARRLMVVHRADVTERLRAAAEYFVRMLHPAESWDFGDSDDADVIPFASSRATAPAEWQAWLAGMGEKSALGFWLGSSPLRGLTFDHVWWMAPHSGMALGESAGWLLRVDASPLGFGSLAAHGHCDALHLSIWDGMQALVIDPGTGGYYGMNERRTALAAWDAHNGPVPAAGYSSPRRLGTFLWAGHHAKPSIREKDARTVAASLKHERHEFSREVVAGANGVITVTDAEVSGASMKSRWCFAPGCKVEAAGENRWLIKRNALRWQVTIASSSDVSSELEEMMVSRRYGQLESAPCIVVKGSGSIVTEWARC